MRSLVRRACSDRRDRRSTRSVAPKMVVGPRGRPAAPAEFFLGRDRPAASVTRFHHRIGAIYETIRLFDNMKTQKSLSHDNLVTIVQQMARLRRQPASTVDECAIS